MIDKWAVTGIIMLFAALFVVLFVLVTVRKEGANPNTSQLLDKYLGKRINKYRLNLLYQKSYVQFMKVPVMKKYAHRVRKRLETLHSYDEYTIRRETMRITLITLGTLSLTVVPVILISRDFMTTLWVLLAAVVVNGIIINTFVNKIEDRQLKKMTVLLEDNRHQYQHTKNVEEALYQANETAPHEATIHGHRIYEILTAEDQTIKLTTYYDVAPNRYYKLFAGIAFLIFEFGDRTIKPGSMYLHALSQLVKVIQEEVLRRDKLNYLLKGLTTISIIPILFVHPLESWARKYFPIMSEYYDGKWGLVAQVSFFVVVLICYLILKKMLENDEMRYSAKSQKRWMWEKKLYKIPAIRLLVDRLVPKRHKRLHFRLTRLLKDANSPWTIEWLYVNRIMASVMCFVVTLGLFFYMHNMTVNDVLYNSSRGMGMYGKLDPKEAAKASQQTEFDRNMINDLERVKDANADTVIQQVSTATNTDRNDAGVVKTSARIINKYNIVKSEYFKWWELVIGILISIIAFNAPVWLLLLQKRMRHMEMQNEVDQFHTIISILAEFERIDVETVLEWMERFAIIFNEPIKQCLNNFSSGQWAAMEQLKQAAPFDSFVRIIEKLQLASEKISVKQAFDDLESAREYYAEQSREYFQRLINLKATWGYGIGLFPMGYIVVLYLIAPMLYLSVIQMSQSMRHITNIQ
jgi:hypothetical protein